MPEIAEASASPARSPGQLDELMLAMDVVDTLRHQEELVSRELDQARRDEQLIERLRTLYRGQGIEVPDRVLQEGVRALKEQRFLYAPPPPGLRTRLALLWVNRGALGRRLLSIAAVLVMVGLAYHLAVVRPAQQRAEQQQTEVERRRIAIEERLPNALQQMHAQVLAESRADAGRERADRLLAQGRSALVRRDVEGAERALASLAALRDQLAREYTLRIVSRPNEPSGVWRIPARNPGARNYYLIVEPVAPDGKILSIPVENEEDGRTADVSRWGVRVSEQVFEAVRRDKNDDGIVQRNRLGEKKRGHVDVDYLMPVLGGSILSW